MSGNTLGTIRGQMVLDVKQALAAYTAVRQDHLSTVSALRAGGGAIAASGAMIAGAGLAMAGGFIAAINAASDFERKLDYFAAVSGATQAEYDAISAKALQLGADTIYSADQIAASFVELSKSGAKTQAIIDGIGEAVTYLGASTDMPLEEAAQAVTTVLNTFGIAAEDAVGVVDRLAGAANASAIDVGDLITTLTYVGASAATANISFEDINNAIALLGERGIKGSKAGTGLRQMLDKLIAPTNSGKDALKELGLVLDDGTNSLLDAQGGLRPIPELLDALNGSLAGLSTSEKMDILGRIFPITSLPTILNLLDGGAAGMRRLNDEIANSSAADIASGRLDNLSGDIEILRGNIDTLMITVGGNFQGFARIIVQAITNIIQAFADLDPIIQDIIIVSALVASIFLIVTGALGIFAGAILNIIGLWQVLSPAIGFLTGLLSRMIGPLIAIIGGFIAGLGPIGLIIALVSALAGALTFFFTQTEAGQAIWGQVMGFMAQAAQVLAPILQQIAGVLGGLFLSALQIVLPIVMAVAQVFMAILGPILPIISSALEGIAAAFSGVGTSASGLEAIVDIVSQVFNGIVEALPIIILAVVNIIISLVTTIVGMIPTLMAGAIQLFMGLVMALVQIIPTLLTTLVTVLVGIITAIIGMIPTLVQAALTLFQGIVTAIVVALPIILQGVTQLLIAVIMALVTAIPLLLQAAIQLFMSIIQALPVIIPMLLEGIIQLIIGVITATVEAIPLLLQAAIDLFMALVLALTEIIPMVIETTIELIPTIIGALISLIPVLIEGAIQLFMALVEAIPEIIPPLIDAIISMGPTIVDTIVKMGPQLQEAGERIFRKIQDAVGNVFPELINRLVSMGTQMIQGLIRGIQSMVNNVIGAVQDVVGGAVDFAKSLLGINSPSRVFSEIGVFAIMGLVKGIHAERRNLNQEMAVIADDMASFYNQVGAAAELDANLRLASNTSTTASLDSTSMAEQLALLSAQLQEIAARDTINIEKIENNYPEPEPSSESLPNNIRKASYLVGG